MFVFTIDSDWAINEVIEDVSNLFESYEIKSTFFLTNEIDFSILKNHELAIHPNFENSTNFEEILQKTLNFLPSKKSLGSRSHKLYYNSTLPTIYQKFGIEYDSNYILFNYEKPLPFYIPHTSILEIPFFFGDDALFDSTNEFEIKNYNLNDSGVKVFMFHPIHIFLNTRTIDDYYKVKKYYKDFSKLKEFRNTSKKGIRNIFEDFLKYTKSKKIQTYTMKQVNDYWRKNFPKSTRNQE